MSPFERGSRLRWAVEHDVWAHCSALPAETRKKHVEAAKRLRESVAQADEHTRPTVRP